MSSLCHLLSNFPTIRNRTSWYMIGSHNIRQRITKGRKSTAARTAADTNGLPDRSRCRIALSAESGRRPLSVDSLLSARLSHSRLAGSTLRSMSIQKAHQLEYWIQSKCQSFKRKARATDSAAILQTFYLNEHFVPDKHTFSHTKRWINLGRESRVVMRFDCSRNVISDSNSDTSRKVEICRHKSRLRNQMRS